MVSDQLTRRSASVMNDGSTMIRFLLGLPFSYRQKKVAASRASIDRKVFVSRVSEEGGEWSCG